MYFSVTSENCSTSPVFSSVLAWRMDLMKLPNSAPRTSRGTARSPTVSTAIPSRPMRLAAIAPSMRSRRPDSTSLNTLHLFRRDLREPALEALDLRVHTRGERVELRAHFLVLRLAREDVLVDVLCIVHETLAFVEIRHGQRVRNVFGGRRRFGDDGREDIGFVFERRRRSGKLRFQWRGSDVHSARLLDLERRDGRTFDRLLEWTLVMRGEHRLDVAGRHRFFEGRRGLVEGGFFEERGRRGRRFGNDLRMQFPIELLDGVLQLLVAGHQGMDEFVFLDRFEVVAEAEVRVGEQARGDYVAGI